MAEGKRYYWLKLYDDFFTSKRIKKLRAIAGGDTYTIIYLKMQLKALRSDGYLYFDNVMGDFAEELALDLDEKPDDVRVTVQYLMSVGLLECNENGEEYFLTYLSKLVGSESASTQRSRDCRARKKEREMLQCNTSATQMQRTCSVEKEIEIDIEKDKEYMPEESGNTPAKKPKKKYGEYKHVLLTDEELEKLKTDFGEHTAQSCITFLDEYIEMKGYKAKSHYLCIRKWVVDAVKERKAKTKSVSPNSTFNNIENHTDWNDDFYKSLIDN